MSQYQQPTLDLEEEDVSDFKPVQQQDEGIIEQPLSLLERVVELLIKAVTTELFMNVAATTIAQPSNRITALLQTSQEIKEKSNQTPWGIIKSQGIFGLWKGSFLAILRNFINNRTNDLIAPLTKKIYSYLSEKSHYFVSSLVSASFHGIIASSVIAPIEVLQVRYISDPNNKGVLAIWRDIVKKRGIEGLYRGVAVSSVLGIVSYRCIYFALFKAVGRFVPVEVLKDPTANFWIHKAILLFADVGSYPFSVVRRRLIASDRNIGLRQMAREIYKKDGVRGFYNGFIYTSLMNEAVFPIVTRTLYSAFMSIIPQEE
ncbi:hypothetical protein ABK040_005313 [Willaertia magna]